MLFVGIIRVYDVISFVDLIQQLWQLGRACLSVVVHGDDVISVCVVECCHLGVVLSCVPGQLYGAYVWIVPDQVSQFADGLSFIRAAVVYEHKFYVAALHLSELLHCFFDDLAYGLR